jgi:hypothetical protein
MVVGDNYFHDVVVLTAQKNGVQEDEMVQQEAAAAAVVVAEVAEASDLHAQRTHNCRALEDVMKLHKDLCCFYCLQQNEGVALEYSAKNN